LKTKPNLPFTLSDNKVGTLRRPKMALLEDNQEHQSFQQHSEAHAAAVVASTALAP